MAVGFITTYAISAYNQSLSPLTLRVRTPLSRGLLDTTLCDKVCQCLATGLVVFSGYYVFLDPSIKLTATI